MKVLQDLYNSEINFNISTFWDTGFKVVLGNSTNEFIIDTPTRTIGETIEWLKQQAIKHYPNSKFATKYKDKGIVQQLRNSGHKVEITHYRYHPKHFNPSPNGEVPFLMPVQRLIELYTKLDTVNPHGGQTIVFITHLESGKTYNGKAVCSLSDTFNRKLGVRIAINRALDGKGV